MFDYHRSPCTKWTKVTLNFITIWAQIHPFTKTQACLPNRYDLDYKWYQQVIKFDAIPIPIKLGEIGRET